MDSYRCKLCGFVDGGLLGMWWHLEHNHTVEPPYMAHIMKTEENAHDYRLCAPRSGGVFVHDSERG